MGNPKTLLFIVLKRGPFLFRILTSFSLSVSLFLCLCLSLFLCLCLFLFLQGAMSMFLKYGVNAVLYKWTLTLVFLFLSVTIEIWQWYGVSLSAIKKTTWYKIKFSKVTTQPCWFCLCIEKESQDCKVERRVAQLVEPGNILFRDIADFRENYILTHKNKKNKNKIDHKK